MRSSSAGVMAPSEEASERLLALRDRIDELDLGILRLVEQRGHVVEEILALKRGEVRVAVYAWSYQQMVESKRRGSVGS